MVRLELRRGGNRAQNIVGVLAGEAELFSNRLVMKSERKSLKIDEGKKAWVKYINQGTKP